MYKIKRFSSEKIKDETKKEKSYSQSDLRQKAKNLVDRMKRDYGETLEILGK